MRHVRQFTSLVASMCLTRVFAGGRHVRAATLVHTLQRGRLVRHRDRGHLSRCGMNEGSSLLCRITMVTEMRKYGRWKAPFGSTEHGWGRRPRVEDEHGHAKESPHKPDLISSDSPHVDFLGSPSHRTDSDSSRPTPKRRHTSSRTPTGTAIPPTGLRLCLQDRTLQSP